MRDIIKQKLTRRNFLKAVTLFGISPSIIISGMKALASSPQLDPENAQAKALEYSHQSSIADKNCANCRLYTGVVSQGWGPCAIFPGQNVATAGWCKAWVARG
jgi:hypothetical protein